MSKESRDTQDWNEKFIANSCRKTWSEIWSMK